jgi:hypothetical protein
MPPSGVARGKFGRLKLVDCVAFGRAHTNGEIAPTSRYSLLERIDECFCRSQVGRAESFSEPVVDLLEDHQGIGGTALFAQPPGRARSGAQLPGQGALTTRPVERFPEVALGRRRGSTAQIDLKQPLARDSERSKSCETVVALS